MKPVSDGERVWMTSRILSTMPAADRADAIHAALVKASARGEQWRSRAKRLIACARDAQFELTAKTIRYAAVMAVLTPAELQDINRRIKDYMAKLRTARVSP